MVEEPCIPAPARARPVAEPALEALAARADELARRWAVALVLARPFDALGTLPLEDLARDAPLLCAQVLLAVQSDVELERLIGRAAPRSEEGSATAMRLAAIAGARDPATLVEAVEELRGALWQALLDQLFEPSARHVAELCDRLSYVCATALAAVVEVLASARDERFDDAGTTAGSPRAAPRTRAGSSAPPQPHAAVIVDEHLPVAAAPVPPGGRWAEIEIRDERREEGAAAWIGLIGSQLERFERDGRPFAVLVAELADLERLRREARPEELAQRSRRLEQELARAQGTSPVSLTRERAGRYWLLVPETGRARAERLAEQLAHRLASAGGVLQRPLAAVIGTAVCPDDGREAAALAAHADVGLFAARSAVHTGHARAATVVDETA